MTESITFIVLLISILTLFFCLVTSLFIYLLNFFNRELHK